MKALAAACIAVFLMGAAFIPDDLATDPESRRDFQDSYVHEREGDYETAAKALLDLHAAHPRDYIVNLRLGWLSYLSGDGEGARDYYRASIKSRPDSLEAKLGYLLTLLAEGQYQEAESIARLIIRKDRYNYYANLRLAFALRMQWKFDQAERVVHTMLKFYPSDVSFLTELGFLRIAEGERAAATDIFNNVLLLDPDNAIAMAQLGYPESASQQDG